MGEEKLFTCKYCGEEKTAEEFRGDSRTCNGIVYRRKACRRKLRAENGEYSKERLRKYSYRKGDGSLLITVEQLEQLLLKRTCTYCGCTMSDRTKEATAATVDHVYSLQGYGGVNIALNIVQACRSCNSSKRDDHVYDFYLRSDKFTEELWTQFVKEFSESLFEREVTGAEVEAMKQNFAAEAAELKAVSGQ